MANELLTQQNDDVTIGIHPKNKVTANLSSAAVGDDEVAGVLGLDVSAVERDGPATGVRHLSLAAVVRQLKGWHQNVTLKAANVLDGHTRFKG